MMKLLYIFPHPDDESFGPAPAIAAQRRQGHEVHLLTLTKGEATKERFRLGVDKQEMGQIRYREMQCMAEVLDLSGMTVLDLPDSGLKEMNPLELVRTTREHIGRIEPDVVITYAVHGISGFEDHLVSHAVVKQAYCELKEEGADYLQRLAFFTRYSEEGSEESKFDLRSSKIGEIDCWVKSSEADMEKFRAALDCYETYQQVIEDSNVKNEVSGTVPFEIFDEDFDPPLEDLTEGI